MPTNLKRFSAIAGTICALVGAPLSAGGVLVFSDGFNAGDSCLWDIGPSSCLGAGFEIESPEVLVGAGEDITYCYYFRTPNEAAVGVKRWALTLGSVTHDVQLYATYDCPAAGCASTVPGDRQTAGVLTAVDCGLVDTGATGTVANWLYGADSAFEELLMPSDDGSGSPLAVEVAANQPMFLAMHFRNPTGFNIANTVTLAAEAFEMGTPYTRTSTFSTFNDAFSIPADAGVHSFAQTCSAPASMKFWMMTTHTHRHATSAEIRDGLGPLVISSNWESPAIQTFASPFYSFSASGLTYECEYVNDGGAPIPPGNDPVTEENCVAIGYFFPATAPLRCDTATGPL